MMQLHSLLNLIGFAGSLVEAIPYHVRSRFSAPSPTVKSPQSGARLKRSADPARTGPQTEIEQRQVPAVWGKTPPGGMNQNWESLVSVVSDSPSPSEGPLRVSQSHVKAHTFLHRRQLCTTCLLGASRSAKTHGWEVSPSNSRKPLVKRGHSGTGSSAQPLVENPLFDPTKRLIKAIPNHDPNDSVMGKIMPAVEAVTLLSKIVPEDPALRKELEEYQGHARRLEQELMHPDKKHEHHLLLEGNTRFLHQQLETMTTTREIFLAKSFEPC